MDCLEEDARLDEVLSRRDDSQDDFIDAARESDFCARMASNFFNRSKASIATAAWRYENPAKVKAIRHRRRAHKLAAEGSFTAQEWEDLKALYGYRCLCCGRREPEIVLTADHVTPLSCGGTNFINNIQPLCKTCNSAKHTRTVDYRKPLANCTVGTM